MYELVLLLPSSKISTLIVICTFFFSFQDNISAKVRLEGERQLKALQIHLSEKQVDETEKKLASKYHMVKFFGLYLFIPVYGVHALIAMSASFVGQFACLKFTVFEQNAKR